MLIPMRAGARTLTLMLVAIAAAGCASAPGRTTNEERWEGWNRGVHRFNDTIDRAALKPVARGYKKITPGWMRTGIGNFLGNLDYPATIVNQFLQGKAKQGLKDTARFLVNTTLGVAGVLDVATALGLEEHDEDFGQTLAVWGVGSGPYLVLPFLGPSSLRDAPSKAGDYFADPLRYTDVPWEAQWGVRGLDLVHTRAGLLIADPTIQRAFDPYAFIRDAWVQRREFEIFDGNPPPEVLDEEWMEDAEEESGAQ